MIAPGITLSSVKGADGLLYTSALAPLYYVSIGVAIFSYLFDKSSVYSALVQTPGGTK